MSDRSESLPAAVPGPRRLKALARPARAALRLSAAAAAVAGVLLIPQAAIIAWLIQQVVLESKAPDACVAAFAMLVAIGALRAWLGWAGRRQADRAVERIRVDLRARIARRVVARGPRWVRSQQSGALAERMGTHVDALEGYFGGFLPVRAEVVAVPLAILAAAFSVDRTVGAILLLTLPLAPVFMMLVGYGAEAASRQQLQALSRMGGHFADRLRGLGLIRLYGQGDSELRGIQAAAEGLRVRSLKVLRIAFLSSAVLEFFASLSVAMVALYLGLSYLGMLDLRTGAPLSLGAGVFCLLLAPEFYAPLRRLAAHYHDRAAALAAVDEITAVLGDLDETAPGDASASATPAVDGATDDIGARLISVRGLRVRHATAMPPVIQALDLTLHRGDHIALAGPSGGGKSTLLEALAGWLPIEDGTIERARGLRIGYAPQRPFLFAGSLADNLRLARPDASDLDLRRAAEAAQVLRFADRLPAGLDTVIGERGFGLSGGEARRIALARVFLRDPDVLLLDEPTAFLDAETEAAVLRAIIAFAQGRALLMATHGRAAMASMQQVHWLRDGRLHVEDAA